MRVHIFVGSESDRKIAEKAEAVLKEFGVEYATDACSAHRNPEKLEQLVAQSSASVFIAIAGLSAALPGVIASKTPKPVIGVPVDVKLNGLDALLSVTQMPPKIPVAAVGIDNGTNAALLAIEMLAIADEQLAKKLEEFRKRMREA